MGIPKVKAKKKKAVEETEVPLKDEGEADPIEDDTVEDETSEETGGGFVEDPDSDTENEDGFDGPDVEESESEDSEPEGDEDESAVLTPKEDTPTVPLKDLTHMESSVVVTKHFTKSGKLVTEDSETETLSVKPFVVQPANVSVNLGTTINLGDYQSAKVSVSVSVPCYTGEIEDATTFAKGFAETKVGEIVNEIQGTTPSGATSTEDTDGDDDETEVPEDEKPVPTKLPIIE